MWVAGARPRTLPAAIVPVLVGHGRAPSADGRRRSWPGGRVAAGAGRGARPPDRHQLRQRLQRRRAGHRRRDAGRARSGWSARGWQSPAAVKRAALASFGVAARGRPGAGRWPRRWWLLAGRAPCASPPAGSTPAARSPTATTASASCSCSCSSAWWPRSARTYVQIERITGLSVAAAVAGRVRSPCALLVVNNLRDIPTDTRRRQEDPGRAPRRPARPACSTSCSWSARCSWSPVIAGLGRPPALLAVASAPSSLARRRCRRCCRGHGAARSSPCWSAPAALQLVFGAAASPSASVGSADRCASAVDAGRAQRSASQGRSDGQEGVGLLEVGGVAGVRRRRRASAFGADGRGQALGRARVNLASCAPATTSTGMVELAEPVPQRLLGAGAGQAQAGGQARRRCCARRSSTCGRARRAARRTAAGPATRRGRRRRRRARRWPASASSAARRAARSAASSMPGGGADAAPAARPSVGAGERGVQARGGRPSSSRRRRPARRRRPRQRGAVARGRRRTRGRAAVAGRVDQRRPRGRRPGRRRSAPSDRPVWVKPWTSTTRAGAVASTSPQALDVQAHVGPR